MKKITLLLVAFLLLAASALNAQKEFAGIIKSKMTVSGTTDPNIINSIPDEIVQYALGNVSKVVQASPGINVTVITNGNTKTLYTVFDITGMGQYYMATTEADITKSLENIKQDLVYTGEKETIAGYSCEKVLCKTVDLETDEENVTTLYVSKDFNSDPSINFASYPGLVGFVMKNTIERDIQGTQVTITTEVTEITPNKKVKPVDFALPSGAKEVKDENELMKILGVGGDDDEDEE